MDRITITINLGGSAFGDDPYLEVSRILKELSKKFNDGDEPCKVMDINGNSVGTIVYEYE